jgi:RecG-like helicase
MVTFFNQAYLAKRVVLGQTVTVMGKWDAQRAQVTANKFMSAGDQEQADSGAVYSVNKHIRQATLRGLIKQAFDEYQNVIPPSCRRHFASTTVCWTGGR